VAFNIAGADSKPIAKIVPGMFKSEVKSEPVKLGWQQPIVAWTKIVSKVIQPWDVYSTAYVETP